MEPIASEPLEVNTRHADRKLWLVKLPRTVAEAWKPNMTTGKLLGSVTVEHPDGAMPIMTLTTEIPIANDGVRTAAFELKTADDQLNLSAFTASHSGPVRFIGSVEHKCDLRTKMSSDYRSLVRKRGLEAEKIVRLRDESSKEKAEMGIVQQGFVDKKNRVQQDDYERRIRKEKDDLQNDLFQCFTKKPQWTLKELGDATQQPLAWLKEVLADFAVLNKKGVQKGVYELKPEFRMEPSTAV